MVFERGHGHGGHRHGGHGHGGNGHGGHDVVDMDMVDMDRADNKQCLLNMDVVDISKSRTFLVPFGLVLVKIPVLGFDVAGAPAFRWKQDDQLGEHSEGLSLN